MELKNYQQQALDTLEFFCKEYSKTGIIVESFKKTREIMDEAYVGYAEYTDLNAPNVCLRIPTGGGKTLLASHSIPLITFDLLNNESSLVVWLAPTKTIVEQTIKALKNVSHPYRQILEKKFSNRTVKILTIKEALTQTFDLSTELPILICTNQVFSVKDEDGRKFYEENSVYEDFLGNTDLEPSLANAIKASNPIVIVDEAHNAKTSLRMGSIVKLNPSFILELTATPQTEHREADDKYASNILYSVSASQLKAEDMIKLPIVVETVDQAQAAISDAITKLKELDLTAKDERLETKKSITPVALFKADRNAGSSPFTYEKVLETLLDLGISRDEIALHTGEHEELNSKENYKYVITVDKLKEGWDEPNAYVLGIMGDISSSTAVEQILGRILRLPYAEPKHHKELEKAYAYVASDKTLEVIATLKDSLINNGFEEQEADLSISASSNSNRKADGRLDGFVDELKLETVDVSRIPEPIKKYINVNKDKKTINIEEQIPESKKAEVIEGLKEAVDTEEERVSLEEFIVQEVSIRNFYKPFSLPKLLINYEEDVFEFDKSILLDEITWDDKDILLHSTLDEKEFDINISKQLLEIDITDNEKLQIQYLDDAKQNLFELSGQNLKLTDVDITQLLLRHLDHRKLQTIGSRQLKKFVHGMVLHLIEERNFSTVDLKANLFYLRDTIFKKIDKLEKQLIKERYESLFSQDELWSLDKDEYSFNFDRDNYPTNRPDKTLASYFKKHYYKQVDKFDSNEEYICAGFIDGLEEVEFWVRNISKQPKFSFWLQTSTDKFYPDFIIQLKNGKHLVIEYKGEDRRTTDDTKEKTKLGKMWASLSDDVEYATVYKENEDDYKTTIKALIKKLGM